jgi:hypothetical protein
MNGKAMQVDPAQLVSEFRENYMNAHALQAIAADTIPPETQLVTPDERPITEEDLSQEMRQLLADYQQTHPAAIVKLLKYQRIENGQPLLIVEEKDDQLPEKDSLLSLSQTVTFLTGDEFRVITDIVVAGIEGG